jgi:hypothetical protein
MEKMISINAERAIEEIKALGVKVMGVTELIKTDRLPEGYNKTVISIQNMPELSKLLSYAISNKAYLTELSSTNKDGSRKAKGIRKGIDIKNMTEL